VAGAAWRGIGVRENQGGIVVSGGADRAGLHSSTLICLPRGGRPHRYNPALAA